MTLQETEIKNFYDSVKFPGLYSAEDITDHGDWLIHDRYLDFFYANKITTLLDIGCGSGYVTNIIAYFNPNIKIVAIDFSDTIKHGMKISEELGIKNIEWRQENFLDFKSSNKFDAVLANGSLHHMPEFEHAIAKAKSFVGNFMLIGLYNKYGKWIQRKIRPKFITDCFELDQIKVPFELSFTNRQVLGYFKDFKLQKVTPGIRGLGVDFFSLFRSKWGGFTFYIFER